jgi:two-component system, cell cycle response regulator
MNLCSVGQPTSDLPLVSPKTQVLLRVIGLSVAGTVLAALLVEIAHNTVGFGSGHEFLIEEWIYDYVTMSAALATLLRAAVRREERLAWALIGLGLLSWALADIYWAVLLTDGPEPPFPNGSDAFYLAGYPLMLAGIVAYVRSRVGRMSAIVWTDVAMGALCVTAIGSSLLLDYVLANTTGTPFEIGVAVAYPALDLVILAVAAGAVALTGWRPGRALGLLALAIVSMAVGDGIYTYTSLAGTYTEAAWYNCLWPLATVLIAAAALQPSPRHRETAPPEGWRAFASPTIFALGVLALLMLERQDMKEPAVAALTVATLIAVVLRLVLTFVQNHRLVVELETDSLTGLFNRGKLIYDLDRLLSADEPPPHLLTILDLDGFKAYNDAFGHPAGDALLVRLGHQLAEAVGDGGRAYRMGGDEFAMLIPGNTEAAGPAVEAGASALTAHGEGFRVTCSSGSAEIPAEAHDRGTALQLADQRMYGQKDSRRPSAGGEVEAVLLRIVNQRAPELGEHADAVKGLAVAVGEDMGLPPGELTAVRRASELHDIGKIAIPDAILTKPGPLDDEEWEFIRQHTILGERIVSAAPSLAPVGRLIRSSHERWDGAGYPDGLAGEEIPLAARIIFVCDAYDAITSERPYSPARGPEAALQELHHAAGTQFDPAAVASLERVLRSAAAEQQAAAPQPLDSRSATSSV